MMRKILIALSMMLLALTACQNQGETKGHPANSNEDVVVRHIWDNADTAYVKYRIPGMVVTKKGTILAFCEGRNGNGGDNEDINLVLRRSTDNGRTWSDIIVAWDSGMNTCGNPCPVVDQETGRILLLMCRNIGTTTPGYNEERMFESREPFVSYSDDDGLTWSEPENLAATCKDESWDWVATGPGRAIQMKSEKYKNRIVVPCNHSYKTDRVEDRVFFIKGGSVGGHVMISDDGGATWRHSEPIRPKCNESQIVELTDGTLMMNMVSIHGLGCRAYALSKDGGETWGPIEFARQLVEPPCQGAILDFGEYQGRHMFLFSNPDSVEDRMNMTIRASFDDCQTWSNSKLIAADKSEYSCMAVLPNGNIGLVFEFGSIEDDWKDHGIMFVSFPPEKLFEPGTLLSQEQMQGK